MKRRRLFVGGLFGLTVLLTGCGSSLVGSGKIVFGTAYKKSSHNLQITKKRDVFKVSATGPIAWVAYFKKNAPKHGLVITIVRMTGGRKTTIGTTKVSSAATHKNEIVNKVPFTSLVTAFGSKPGTYRFTYHVGGTVYATGSFHLVR